MGRRRAFLATLGLTVALALSAPVLAPAERGLVVGITDDAFMDRPATAFVNARDLGLGGFRVSLAWAPGARQMSPAQIASFTDMVNRASGLRAVVSVFGRALDAPQDDAGRDSYCAFVRDLLSRFPAVHDVVIWNEANLGFFWRPQYNPDGASAAPAAYEALLARCWDVLHAFSPDVNIIISTSPSGNDDPNAGSNVSHSPVLFIHELGAAFRASGRIRPIFDTVGHNPYGRSSSEAPWAQHLAPSHIGEGDLDRLVQALDDGFGGTAQPIPGHCVPAASGRRCVSIWYLEGGYQTVPDAAHERDYTGRENDAQPLPDVAAPGRSTQSTQLTDGIELAYCQPYVTAFFNFLLRDEPDLARWQSGLLWADGEPKSSYGALKSVIGDIAAGNVDCSRLRSSHPGAVRPTAGGLVERIEWPSLTAFSSFNDVWSFAIDARADAGFRAVVVRVDHGAAKRGAPLLTVRGSLRHDRPRLVTFPARTLPPGAYRMQIEVTRRRGTRSVETRASPVFLVK